MNARGVAVVNKINRGIKECTMRKMEWFRNSARHNENEMFKNC